LSRRRRAVVATLGDKARDFVAKIQFIEFLAIFFLRFFSCVIACTGVATHAIFAARWRRDNFQKNRITIASKKKIKKRSCSRSLWP